MVAHLVTPTSLWCRMAAALVACALAMPLGGCAECVVDADCDAAESPCVFSHCQKGACLLQPFDATPACDDGDPCSVGDTCANGACTAGVSAICTDDKPCTHNYCVTGVGCAVEVVKTGLCDDGISCTQDACAETGDCQFLPLAEKACDDNNACTKDDQCTADGVCVGTEVPEKELCADDLPCTPDHCDPAKGCEYWVHDCPSPDSPCLTAVCTPAGCGVLAGVDWVKCDAGNPCYKEGVCQGGKCAPTEWLCDDDNPCTKDVCEAEGCVHKKLPNGTPCGDGADCTCGVDDNLNCPGGAGCACDANWDCDSAFCLTFKSGKACAQQCIESCPDGLVCEAYETPSGLLLYFCLEE